MKILFVIDSLRPGGAERSLVDLLPLLINAGVIPVLVCLYHYSNPHLEKIITANKIHLHTLTSKSYIHRILELRQIIRIVTPDTLHTSLIKSDILGRFSAIGQSTSVLSSLISMPYDPIRLKDPQVNIILLRLIQLIDSLTARYLTTHFHSVSQSVKRAAVMCLGIPSERITVIERGRDPAYLGLPDPIRRSKARCKLGIKYNTIVIVNVGRHVYAKGQKYLLLAMAKIMSIHQDKDILLLVAGSEGPATTELKRLHAQLGLLENTRFLGHRDDIPDILSAADIFAFPSLYEGLPGAVIEAMALGLPIVGFDIPPVRETVEDQQNGILVECKSVDTFANAISDLIMDHEKMKRFGKRSRELFEKRFTLNISADRMVNLYRKMVSASGNM